MNVKKDLMLLECNAFAMVLLFMENVTVVPTFQTLNGIMESVNVSKALLIIMENVFQTPLAMMILHHVMLELTLILNKENV